MARSVPTAATGNDRRYVSANEKIIRHLGLAKQKSSGQARMPGQQNNASLDERKLTYRWRHTRERGFLTPEVVAALTSELEWHAPEDDTQRIVKPVNPIEKSMQPMEIHDRP